MYIFSQCLLDVICVNIFNIYLLFYRFIILKVKSIYLVIVVRMMLEFCGGKKSYFLGQKFILVIILYKIFGIVVKVVLVFQFDLIVDLVYLYYFLCFIIGVSLS